VALTRNYVIGEGKGTGKGCASQKAKPRGIGRKKEENPVFIPKKKRRHIHYRDLSLLSKTEEKRSVFRISAKKNSAVRG